MSKKIIIISAILIIIIILLSIFGWSIINFITFKPCTYSYSRIILSQELIIQINKASNGPDIDISNVTITLILINSFKNDMIPLIFNFSYRPSGSGQNTTNLKKFIFTPKKEMSEGILLSTKKWTYFNLSLSYITNKSEIQNISFFGKSNTITGKVQRGDRTYPEFIVLDEKYNGVFLENGTSETRISIVTNCIFTIAFANTYLCY